MSPDSCTSSAPAAGCLGSTQSRSSSAGILLDIMGREYRVVYLAEVEQWNKSNEKTRDVASSCERGDLVFEGFGCAIYSW